MALLAQQDPEHPIDKTQQGQERHLINELKDGRLNFLSQEFSATWMTENIYQYIHDDEGEHLHHHHHRNCTALCSAGM